MSGGSNTSALAFGGQLSPGASANTELWNGTNWTEVNNVNTARRNAGDAGTDNTSGLIFGGNAPPGLNLKAQTENWNGTNWTEVNDLNQARLSLAGAGTATSALGFGGYQPSPAYAVTEKWNGVSWTEVACWLVPSDT